MFWRAEAEMETNSMIILGIEKVTLKVRMSLTRTNYNYAEGTG